MKTKSKKVVARKLSKKLYNLLSEAEVISDGERGFWLESYSALSSEAQEKLSQIVRESEKELAKENEAHLGRVAEIDTKCLAQLQTLAKTNGLKAVRKDDDENVEDFDPDEIWKQLQEAGEV